MTNPNESNEAMRAINHLLDVWDDASKPDGLRVYAEGAINHAIEGLRAAQSSLATQPQTVREAIFAGVSRSEWHDKAWALYHSKTFDDTMLAKVNVHTIRAVLDATFDAISAQEPKS